MTNGYEEIYGEVAGQRKRIAERKTQLDRPVVSGTAKQRRIIMRRVKRTPEYKRHMEAKRGELSALGKAAGEISEYESKIKGYEEKGYDIERTDGGLQFSKQVYVPGKRVSVGPRERSVYVEWVNLTTGKTGRFKGEQSKLADYERQLSVSDRSITKISTVGGGEAYKTEEGYWTSKNIVLAEAVPIYETVYGKRDEKPLGEITVRHLGMDKKLDLGFDRKTLPSKPVTDVELAMIKVSDISRVHTMREMTKSKIVGYMKIPESERKIIEAGLPTSARVTERYGSERLDIYAMKHIQDWGIPGLIAGVQTISGIDKTAWERLREQYASEILESTRKKGEPILNYASRFWTSEQAIRNVYFPLATMGVGYVAKPFIVGIKTIPVTSKIFPITSRLAYYAPTISKITIGGVVGITGFQIATAPDSFALILGRTTASFGKMFGGFYAGGKLYGATHAKIIQESYWAGTQYEQEVIRSWSYKPDMSVKWGGYERSWSFYRQSLIGEAAKRQLAAQAIVKGTAYTGKGDILFRISREPVTTMKLVDPTRPSKAVIGKDYKIREVGRSRFGYPRLESETKMFPSAKQDYPLLESQAKIYKVSDYGKVFVDKEFPGISIRGTPVSTAKRLFDEVSQIKTIPIDSYQVQPFIKTTFAGARQFTPKSFGVTINDLQTMWKMEEGVAVVSKHWFDTVPISIQKTIPLTGVTSLSLTDVMQRQNSLQKQILSTSQLSLTDLKQESIQIQKLRQESSSLNIQKSLSASLLLQSQLQRQMRKQKTMLKLAMPFIKPVVPHKPTSYIYTPDTTIPSQPIPKPPVPFYFELPEGKPTKKRKKKAVDEYGMGYRFRRWKVPTMKQIIGINNNKWM